MKRILSKSGAVALLAAVSTVSLSFAQPGPGFDPNAPGVPGAPGRRGFLPGAPGVPNPGPGGFLPGRRLPGVPVPIIPVPPRPPVPAEADGSVLVAQVQRKLKKLGYYEGVVDGEMGRGTRGAIRAYQNENGLAETGVIDRPLLRSLGLQ